MNHIILTGIPYSGKTTLGKKAAQELNLPFYDTYEIAREKAEAPLPGLVFDQEAIAIKELSELKTPAVIELSPELALELKLTFLKKIGTVVFIDRDAKIILEKIDEIAPNRPMLVNTKDETYQIDVTIEGIEAYEEEIFKFKSRANKIFENNGDEESAINEFTEFLRGII